MSRWIHFKYNKAKGRYERKKPSPWRHFHVFIRHLLSGMIGGALLLYLFIYLVGSPGEWKLEREYELLERKYNMLDTRLNEALAVMEDIGLRDDNLYRVIMQGDPIGTASRKALINNDNRYDELLNLSDAQLLISVSKKLDSFERQLYLQSKSFDEIAELCKSQEDRLQCIPAIQPVADKELKRMASGYGWRIDPVYNVRTHHNGMDFSAPKGTDVFVTGNGRVTSVGWMRGYGLCVDVDHGYGYSTRYAHLSKKNVYRGQKVKRGEKIGEVGNSGKSTAPHLHYEVRLRGVPQNPAHYYYLDLTPEQYEEVVSRSANIGQMLD